MRGSVGSYARHDPSAVGVTCSDGIFSALDVHLLTSTCGLIVPPAREDVEELHPPARSSSTPLAPASLYVRCAHIESKCLSYL